MIVGGQTSARALTIIDYHQLSLTIMHRLTRALDLDINIFYFCTFLDLMNFLDLMYLDLDINIFLLLYFFRNVYRV